MEVRQAHRANAPGRRHGFSVERRNGMKSTLSLKTSIKTSVLAASLAGALLCLPQVSQASGLGASGLGAGNTGATGQPAGSNSADGGALARLDKKQFKNVSVQVDNGVATLTGTVDLYQDKTDAGKRVMKTAGVTAINNEIQVAGASVSDSDLETQLGKKLMYDRVGYGNVFNAISFKVVNGAVTLGGFALDPVSKDSALTLAATTPGVKNVTDQIQVDPASPMDNRIRMAVERAVYGYPTLNRYAIDPAAPIRIAVQNGNVELFGMVDNSADKNVAYLRANGVPGVFSVKNYLQVANQPTEAQ
jgi:hyperosmotically inducible periplasmic protein